MSGVKDTKDKLGEQMSKVELTDEEKRRRKIANAGNVRPAFQLYHPNSKGNGSAIGIRVVPASLSVLGCVQLEIARQMTVGNVEQKVFPTFNWKDRIIVRLTPVEVAEMCRCLRGITPSIREGAGFSHRTDGGASKVTLVHVVEPKECFQLKVMHETIAGVDREVSFYIYPAEAFAIEAGLFNAMGALCFGV